MRIDIFDVGHGACSLISCPNGTRVMIDCGFNSETGWYPSDLLSNEQLDLLIFSNLDEDHVDDFPSFFGNVGVTKIFTNPTIGADELHAMKLAGGMDNGVAHVAALLRARGAGHIGPNVDCGEVRTQCYFNAYAADFEDTNNLSVATFVSYKAFKILYAGDMETAGWRKLLANPFFLAELSTVRLLVASHHGRASGRCAELFQLCHPEAVIFSDCAKKYETQETDAWYRCRVKGIPNYAAKYDVEKACFPKRHVLTTRRDGHMSIDVNEAGGYLIRTERDQQDSALADLYAYIESTRARA